ncbi:MULTISPECIES: TonB-dependent receptor [Bacteroidaceae]|uniref:SusC/RagA family TonB-linked outer membrane protein n=1 Tax=Bacteroidaceae TaxID=815 RepID=UPI000B38ED38|nr:MULTISPECIES: TonB-dependent receptor [Bacteroidaceae]MDM8307363.1 TonB-dependent receptor [Phocaeicola salanitronis]OUO18941.1 SusC/RagA family TonB-linked outer membrane protein [Bacteroides sp. An322]
MKRSIFVVLCLCFTMHVFSQNLTIKGVVLDETGQSVIGATVLEEGTENGTITNLDGEFFLTVAKGKSLVISYIGFETQRIRVVNEKQLKIILHEDSELLDEVVVVGYGVKQKRSTMTTAISKMDQKVLQNAALSNAAQALQGTVSGLRVTNTSGAPGSAPTIVLRGGAGIESAGSPLVVVDGVVRSMSDINPSDIESIQVLKDAASTAIYGARANNGVILVQTKKGKAGHTQVSYKFKGGMNFARKGYEYMDAENYIRFGRLGRMHSGGSITDIDNTRGYGAVYGANNPEQYSIRYLDGNENLLQEGWKQMTDPVTGRQIVFKDYGTTLRDEVYKDPAFTQDHYLSFNGGSEKGTFAASLGYYSEDGTVKGTEYRRFSGTLNGNYKVLPILNIKGGVSFSTSTAPELYYDDMADLFERMQSMEPTWKPFFDDGSPNYGYGKRDGNPLYWLDKLTNKNNTRKTTLNIGADLELVKDKLFLRENSSIYYEDYTRELFDKEYRDYWNVNTERKASFAYQRTIQQQHSVQLEYTDTFKENHNFSAMLGGEYFENQYTEYSGSGQGAPFDDIPTLNASGNENMTAYSYREGYRIASFFGRVTYDYKRRYLFTAVARYDGISRLSDNRWGFFPGVSAGWNIHEEAFFHNSPIANVVSTLKPRISYGINGNVNGISNYDVYGLYGQASGTHPYNGVNGILNTAVINSQLRWEKSKSFEAGLDLGFLNNRFNLILDYYNRTTSDLLTDVNLPGYTGFDSFKTNLGTLRNSGFEVEGNLNLITNPKGFNWNFSFNASYVFNKIVKLPDNGNENNRQGGSQVWDPASQQVIWVGGYQEGHTLGDIYAYQQVKILRDENEVAQLAGNRIDMIAGLYGPNVSEADRQRYGLTKPIEAGDVLWADLNGDNVIDQLDRVKVGNIYPKWTGGFSTTLSYKNVSLYGRFDFAVGHTILNMVAMRSIGQSVGFKNIIADGLDCWTAENPDTDLPKSYYDDSTNKKNIYRDTAGSDITSVDNRSSRFYEKGDYLALRELTLSWKLPAKWISKIHITDASLYVTGQNLFYITGYSGTSPEAPLVYPGVDTGRYPTPRTVLVGASVSF